MSSELVKAVNMQPGDLVMFLDGNRLWEIIHYVPHGDNKGRHVVSLTARLIGLTSKGRSGFKKDYTLQADDQVFRLKINRLMVVNHDKAPQRSRRNERVVYDEDGAEQVIDDGSLKNVFGEIEVGRELSPAQMRRLPLWRLKVIARDEEDWEAEYGEATVLMIRDYLEERDATRNALARRSR